MIFVLGGGIELMISQDTQHRFQPLSSAFGLGLGLFLLHGLLSDHQAAGRIGRLRRNGVDRQLRQLPHRMP